MLKYTKFQMNWPLESKTLNQKKLIKTQILQINIKSKLNQIYLKKLMKSLMKGIILIFSKINPKYCEEKLAEAKKGGKAKKK